MNQRQRRHEAETAGAATTASAGGGIGEQGDRLLRAGDEAIDRILSGNSSKFLESMTQSGGQ